MARTRLQRKRELNNEESSAAPVTCPKVRKRSPRNLAHSQLLSPSISHLLPDFSPPPRKKRANRTNKNCPEECQYQSQMSLRELPSDCMVAVLCHLPVRCRIRLERVSQQWYSMISESWSSVKCLDFWDVIQKTWDRYGEPTSEPQLFLDAVLRRCGSYLEEIKFAACPPFRLSKYTVELMGKYCPGLVSLDLTGRLMTDKALEALRSMPKLKRLVISKCYETGSYDTKKAVDKALLEVLKSLPNLRVLQAEYNKSEAHWGKGGAWCSRLKLQALSVGNCSLNSEAFQQFITGNVSFIQEFRASESTFASGNWNNIDKCQKLLRKALGAWKGQLKVLELRDFTGTYATEFGSAMRMIPSLTSLEKLSLKSNKFIDDDILEKICGKCKNLTALNLAGCAFVKKIGLSHLVELPHLRKLDVRRSRWMDDSLVYKLCYLGRITWMCLRECPKVTPDALMDLVVNCSELSFVDVAGCKKLLPSQDLRRIFATNDHVTVQFSDSDTPQQCF